MIYDVVAIAAGDGHGVALKADGTVWDWGANFYGQLGDGTTTQRNAPVRAIGVTNAVAIAAGQYHTLALKSDGTVMAWGYNNNGQLGDGTNTNRSTPVVVTNLSGGSSVSAGTHEVIFRNPQFTELRQMVTVASGKATRLAVTLTKK